MGDSYQERKERQECTYPGCSKPPGDCGLCPEHHTAAKERKRDSQNAMREARRKKKQCPYCGRPCGADYACPKHRVQLGRAKTRVEAVPEDKSRRIKERTVVDDDGRVRYHGRERRGRIPIAQEDREDLQNARRLIDKAIEGLAYAKSPEVAALPRTQREDVTRAALAHANHAGRFVVTVLDRHKYGDETNHNIALLERKVRR